MALNHRKSKQYFTKAKRIIPGGVNSPVRAFKAVGGNPIFIKSAKGSKIYDVDGNEYIDYVLSWGPMILGHTHPKVTSALKKAADHGTSYGAPTPLEIDLATMIRKAYPSMWMRREPLFCKGISMEMTRVTLSGAAFSTRET